MKLICLCAVSSYNARQWCYALSLSQLEECALQLAYNGNYLDLDSSLSEQRDDLEQLYDDVE